MSWTLLDPIALLLGITAVFAYFNHYVLGLPRNIGLLVLALAFSIALRLLSDAIPGIELVGNLRRALDRTDFASLLLNGFLGFLLFAAAVDIDPRSLFERKWTIIVLATLGVLLSTLLVGLGMWGISRLFGLDIPFLYCLAFGALISPTDPVTVLGVLQRLPVPASLRAIIAGESLFNDGAGIVLYSVFVTAAAAGQPPDAAHVALDFLRSAGGGLGLGVVAGGLAFLAMRGIDDYNIELIISLTLVTGTYGLADTIEVSGPVAVVVAGLIMGSIGAQYAVSGTTRDYLSKFWSLTDELLNALLFLIIGLEFVVIRLEWTYIGVAALAILLSLAARAASISLASLPLNLAAPHKLRAIALTTWSGLRGGISVALALALPASAFRDPLLTASYGVVIFTMLAQGLSLGPVGRRLYRSAASPGAP